MAGLPGILLPGGVPNFVESSQEFDESDVYARVRPAAGASRTRALFTATEQTVKVSSKRLSQAQMTSLDEWFENTLRAGERHFSVELTNEGLGTRWWEAMWKAPWTAVASNGRWVVSGELVLFGDGSADAPADGSLAAEYGIALEGSGLVTTSGTLSLEIVVALTTILPVAAEYGVAVTFIQDGATPSNDFRDRRRLWAGMGYAPGRASDITSTDLDAVRRSWMSL